MIHIAEYAVGRQGARYRALSMALHWSIALLIFVQMGLGWWMNEVMPSHASASFGPPSHPPAYFRMLDLHISLGLTTLILVVVRLGSRLAMPVPELPHDVPVWERRLASTMHVLFYGLMLMLPLTGWALVSARHQGTFYFWGLPWPRLPGFLPGVPGHVDAARRSFIQALRHFHVFTEVWIAWAMIALHVTGAAKHQFDGHPVLWRMVPFLKAQTP